MKAEAKFQVNGSWEAGGILEPITCRAQSLADLPRMGGAGGTGGLMPLNRDSDRAAFLFAWAQAKRGGSPKAQLSAFAKQARSIRAAWTDQH